MRIRPMKRSEALSPLSRDHHQALVAAQRLRRGGEPGELASGFRAFWDEQGSPHFRIEEEVLLPLWASLGTADPGHVRRIAEEHLEIRRMALELERDPDPELLRRLGELLQAHVRFEERELFPAIEADLGEAELAELAAAVVEAESA
jgi:hypothetical protein